MELNNIQLVEKIKRYHQTGQLPFTCIQHEANPDGHYWIPVEEGKYTMIKETVDSLYDILETSELIENGYKKLASLELCKPNRQKGVLWVVSRTIKWGRKSCLSKLELLSIWSSIFAKAFFCSYSIQHGNITGDHVWLDSKGNMILMTPARFITRPNGYEIARSMGWWLLKRPDLLREISHWFVTTKDCPQWVKKLVLLGIMYDISNGTPPEGWGDSTNLRSYLVTLINVINKS